MDLHGLTDEETLSLLSWASENSLWDGREVHIEDFSKFSFELEEKIKLLLLSPTLSDLEIYQLSVKLAYLGGKEEEQGQLADDVRELGFLPNGTLIQSAGLGKSISKFWKKHKTEIIIGAAIVGVITTVAIIALTSGGTAAGAAAAAGSSALKNLQEGPEDRSISHGNARTLAPPSPSTALPENYEFLDRTSFAKHPPQIEITPQIPNWNPNPKPLFPELSRVFPENPHEALVGPSWKVQQPISTIYDNIPSIPSSTPIPRTNFLERSIPVFSSSDHINSKSWFDWTMQTIGLSDTEPLPSAPENNFCMVFRTKGERSPNFGVGLIHGLGNFLPDAIQHAEYLSNLNGGRSIETVYNKSNTPLIDLLEAGFVNIPGESPNTAKLLQENWVEFHHKNIDNPKLKYLQVCHSQGAIHVRNALILAPQEIRDRVIVVAIAPAAVVPRELCFDSTNYATKTDIVPKSEIVVSGVLDLLHREGLTHIIEALEKQDQIIWVEPHPDSKGMGHGFQDPSYKEFIKKHTNIYISKGGEF